MLIELPSVTKLVAKFEQLVDRTGPEDTKAARYRVPARNAKPSAVANTPRDSSIRHQAVAGPQPVRRPTPLPASSEHGRGTNPATSRSTTETPVPRYQANFAKHRAVFEQLASKSNEAQTPVRLDRAVTPKRLGTGIHSGTVVWEPTARDRVSYPERVPSRSEVMDRPQTMQPGKSTKTPGPIVNHLANIVRNGKAKLRACKASVAPGSERIDQAARFSMARIPSSRAPLVPPGHGHLSPVDDAPRSGQPSVFLQYMLVDSHIDSSKRVLSPGPDERAHSDYESDSSGSSAGSSPPGSPNALDPVISWSQVLAEDPTVTELKDELGQLERAIENENKYRVPDDAADQLDLAMEHYRNGDIPGAYAAIMAALDGVTEILAPPGSRKTPSPADSDYASDSDKPGLSLDATSAELSDQITRDDLLSEARDKAASLSEGVNHAWIDSRLNLGRARTRIQATIKRHTGTTWEGRAKVLLAKVDTQARIDRLAAIDMARDGLKTIAGTQLRRIDPEY